MALIKTKEEIEVLREGGRRLAATLHAVAEAVRPGVTAHELDQMALTLIRKGGDKPAFLNYKPAGARIAFPATLCISVNDHVVHGIPTDRALAEGDIVGLDLGIIHKDLFTDMAVTVPVGKIEPKYQKLIDVTRDALYKGVEVVRPGTRIGDIGAAIEAFVKPYGYGIVRDLGGHGVGHAVHESPHIPNFGKNGTGEILKPGMVIAIEPMLNEGSFEVVLAADKFTYKTRDGGRSAHFELTLAVTESGYEILTR